MWEAPGLKVTLKMCCLTFSPYAILLIFLHVITKLCRLQFTLIVQPSGFLLLSNKMAKSFSCCPLRGWFPASQNQSTRWTLSARPHLTQESSSVWVDHTCSPSTQAWSQRPEESDCSPAACDSPNAGARNRSCVFSKSNTLSTAKPSHQPVSRKWFLLQN